MPKTKIGILGVGAIGSVISTQLSRKQQFKIQHFNRSNIEKINLAGPNTKYSYQIDCQTVISKIQDLEWLIICIKEHHFSNAKNWFKNLISPPTKVAIIRNGIYLKEPLLPFCESEKILECMIDCPVQKNETGVYHQFKNPTITVPGGNLAEQFAVLFRESDTKMILTEDFKTATWFKLCESTAIGAITCLTRKPCVVFQNPTMENLYRKILAECYQAAIADGAILPKDYIEKMLLKLKTYSPEKGSSMLSDRLSRKEIELGAKSGAIVDIGKKSGIKTPLNQIVCELIRDDFRFNLEAFE